ncbi:MAG TPA: hypothetical protein VGF67_06430 [Ktedonobacteraceae bacterium]
MTYDQTRLANALAGPSPRIPVHGVRGLSEHLIAAGFPLLRLLSSIACLSLHSSFFPWSGSVRWLPLQADGKESPREVATRTRQFIASHKQTLNLPTEWTQSSSRLNTQWPQQSPTRPL